MPNDQLLSIAAAALIGLQFGSFLNVVVWRLPQMLEREWQAASLSEAPDQKPAFNLSTPRSHCPHCHTSLRWQDLIPVLSYLWLRGRCAHCAAPVAMRYPLVELAVSALWGLCAWRWGMTAPALAWAGFFTTLLGLALIDADTMLLPDAMTLPLLWAGLIAANMGLTDVPLSDALWGAVAGYLSLWLVYQVFLRATGKHGLGGGDFKLLAALGAWLGWQVLPWLVLGASLLGLGAAAVLMWRGQYLKGQHIPLGPSLALAGTVLALWQPALTWGL
jgi:leader peptidase (prepilin peptidase)/N-methyltransferase